MRIAFFGTSRFSAGILEVLKDEHDLVLVVTQPDKPVGRKKIIQQSPVANLAEQLHLPIIKPANFKDSTVAARIASADPEIFVVIAYGKIIPQSILDLAPKGAINIHPSLLPKYRGASPIQAALLHGDKETGVSIMLMDKEMDHGPILCAQTIEIEEKDTFIELELKLLGLAKKLIIEATDQYFSGKIKPQPQDDSQATFCKILTKEDGRVDWNKPASDIYNQFRAFITWPGIWTTWQKKTLKLLRVALAGQNANENGKQKKPGEVFGSDGKIFVATASASLQIFEVQLEGAKPMAVEEFVKGHRDFITRVPLG